MPSSRRPASRRSWGSGSCPSRAPLSAPQLAARYHPLPLTAEQLGIPGYLERVSTRVPGGTGPVGEAREANAHATALLNADRQAMSEVPASYGKNSQLITRIPSIRIAPGS